MSETTFSITSALPVPRHLGRRWWTAVARYFNADAAAAAGDAGDRRVPKHYPPRSFDYLADAAMRRAMDRL